MKILAKEEVDRLYGIFEAGGSVYDITHGELEEWRNSHEDLRELLRRLWEYLPWHLQDAIELDNPELWEAVMEAIGDG